jgi:hypothetical protein
MHPELLAAVEPHKNLTFLLTEHGASFTSAGFGNWFRDRCDEAGLKHCSAHGLRKAAATRLANVGCSNEQIKAITGHRSDASLARCEQLWEPGAWVRKPTHQPELFGIAAHAFSRRSVRVRDVIIYAECSQPAQPVRQARFSILLSQAKKCF